MFITYVFVGLSIPLVLIEIKINENIPVTFGSKVPECPVFSHFKIRLTHATISCELGLLGLSKLMYPYLMYSRMFRHSGDEPNGNGV